MARQHAPVHMGTISSSWYHRHEVKDPQRWMVPEPHYTLEDELFDELEKLPDEEQIRGLMERLRVSTLRQLSTEVVSCNVEFLKRERDQLSFAKLLNSWIATAEETIVAGPRVKRIAARRRSS